jgi:hypothetical protein
VSLRFLTILTFSLSIGYACECTEPSVQQKKDNSDLVFRGTITALRDSEKPADLADGWVRDTKKIAVFRVSRVWKGKVAETFEMPAVEETSMCVGFSPDYLKVGSDLLIYARRHRGWGSEYYTGICGQHKLSTDADKDFKELGTGSEPERPEEKAK